MPYPEDEPRRASGTAFLVAVALLIAFAIIYIIGLRGFQEDAVHREAIYNPDRSVPDAYLQVNASILRIDPLQSTMALKLVFTPKGTLAGVDGRSSRQDIRISLPAAEPSRDVVLRAGQRPQPAIVTLGLDGLDIEGGEINQYPLDHYRARFEVLVLTGAGDTPAPAASPRLPVILVFDAAMHGIHVDSKIMPGTQTGDIMLELAARRSRTFVALILSIEALMAAIALSTVLVAGAVALGRRVDFSMIVWTGALLFVFPAIRAALPGSPPPGVLADVLVFFWAVLLVALSMAVLVSVWLRRAED